MCCKPWHQTCMKCGAAAPIHRAARPQRRARAARAARRDPQPRPPPQREAHTSTHTNMPTCPQNGDAGPVRASAPDPRVAAPHIRDCKILPTSTESTAHTRSTQTKPQERHHGQHLLLDTSPKNCRCGAAPARRAKFHTHKKNISARRSAHPPGSKAKWGAVRND